MNRPPAPEETAKGPRPSTWERFRAGAGIVLKALFPARFEDKTPLLPDPAHVSPSDEDAERMLVLLLRASPRYQKAALALLRQAIAAREAGENEYAEFVVHFALSRMRTDGARRVTMAQLRDELRHLPHLGTLLPALRRLEEQGVVVLIVEKSDDPMTELLRSPITHVELRMPW